MIADTHNVYDERIDLLFAGADLIFHAGDICKESILDPLRTLAPLVTVLGNNDMLTGYKEIERRECNGVRFFMTHILPYKLPTDCDWLIFGHTHVPENRMHQGLLLFNPGSAGKGNKGAPRSVATLHWRNGAWEPELHILH